MKRKKILLISNRDEIQDLVSLAFESIDPESPAHAALGWLSDSALLRRSTAREAITMLASMAKAGDDPALVFIDTFVPAGADSPPGAHDKGSGEVLDWLESNKPDLPVVLLADEVLQQLNLKILSRQNVVLWRLDPAGRSSLADALAALATRATPRPKRITVEVGEKSARYRIRDGRYEFTTDSIPYSDVNLLKCLVQQSEAFSPYDPNQIPRTDWQSTLLMSGKSLFQILLKDSLGPYLETLEDQPVEAVGTAANPDIDMRFDIDLSAPESERLFGLPFEVVNHDSRLESFMCTRVPMARRIRSATEARVGHAHQSTAASNGSRKLRILFVDANFSGTVSVTHEVTGARLPRKDLPPIFNTVQEAQVLTRIAKESGVAEEPVIIDGSKVAGQEMLDQMEAQLRKGSYDIFHFSGHSLSYGEGGTFLVLPSTSGSALPVSVRQVAVWAKQGSCKLFVLSSCRGGSLRTAIEAMNAGVDAALGFRWDVDDEAAVEYFKRFYRAYLQEKLPFTSSYRDACRSVSSSRRGTPVWASAVAVVRD